MTVVIRLAGALAAAMSIVALAAAPQPRYFDVPRGSHPHDVAADPVAGGAVELPTIDGIATTFIFAAGALPGTTITASVSTTLPPGAPQLPSTEMLVEYVTFSFSQTMPIASELGRLGVAPLAPISLLTSAETTFSPDSMWLRDHGQGFEVSFVAENQVNVTDQAIMDAGYMWFNYFNAGTLETPITASDFGASGPYFGVKWIGNV